MSQLKLFHGHKVRAVKTLILSLGYASFGVAISITGPALLDLALLVNTSLGQISNVFPVQCTGAIIGSLLLGVGYPHFNFQLSMSLVLSSLGIITALVPMTADFYIMITLFFFRGILLGIYQAGGNVYMLDLWGSESEPFFQMISFTFGVGALIGPLIVEPFLFAVDEDVNIHRKLPALLNISAPQLKETQSLDRNDLLIHFPFWICGFALLVTGSMYFIMWESYPHTKIHESRKRDRSPPADATSSRQESRSYLIWKYIAIALVCLYMLIYLGIELTFGQYLTCFGVKSDLHLSKERGAEITSTYWATFTIFRLFTAFYISYIGPEGNVAMNTVIMLLGNVCLMLFGSRYEYGLRAGSILMGMGSSSTFGSVYGYLEIYFSVTPTIGSLIVVSLTVGEMVFPAILSQYLEEYPNIFLDVTLICTLALAIIFPLIVIVCKLKLGQNNIANRETIISDSKLNEPTIASL